MTQLETRTMAWARMPAAKGEFRGQARTRRRVFETLQQILVDQTGIAQGVYLVTDPQSGREILVDIHLKGRTAGHGVPLDAMVEGIPVRYTWL